MNTTKKVKGGASKARTHRQTQNHGQHPSRGNLFGKPKEKRNWLGRKIVPNNNNFEEVTNHLPLYYVTQNAEEQYVYNSLSKNDITSFNNCKDNEINNERIMLKDSKFYIKKPHSQNVWIQLQQLQYIEPIIE
jgi:hypothetical protein